MLRGIRKADVCVRYVLEGEPQATVICHGTHCQKQSGSALSVDLLTQENDVELRGETAFFAGLVTRPQP